MLKNVDDLGRVLEKQRRYDDIFITKYGNGEHIDNIILDFDGAEDKKQVFKEVSTIHRFLGRKGLNSVIVSSTNKGFHFYLQIPTMSFGSDSLSFDRKERNRLFVMFTKRLIDTTNFQLDSLDPTNTNAGLGGNIRLLGSRHPKTDKEVNIVKGEFLNLLDEEIKKEYYENCSHYVNYIYKSTLNQYKLKEEIREEELAKKRKLYGNKKWKDPIRENDLRDLLPQLYGGVVKKYDGYIFMQCPWHTDRNPSCKVTKEWFYCTGCGKKGNIWTLIKDGEFKL